MKQLFLFLVASAPILVLALAFSLFPDQKESNTISLEGKWQVKLDSLNVGEKENWAASDFKNREIMLPGTLDDAKIGKPNTLKPALNNYVLSNLARNHQYIGTAWYQKKVEIPRTWKKKKIVLNIERVLWESKVYIDGKLVGSANSLIGNHVFDLSNHLSSGKHLLTVAIDNSNKFPYINVTSAKYPGYANKEMAHAYTNHTQIKWNGMLGDISLKASNINALTNLQVYPIVEDEKLLITFEQKKPVLKKLTCEISDVNGNIILNTIIKETTVKNNVIHFKLDRPKNLKFWDEFNPALYDVKIVAGKNSISTRFGYKIIGKEKGVLTLNGQRIFLRGNLECAIFPLTGYPPMEKSGWAKLIAQAKNYGLNHLRFHSWCPPKAAFEAADEAGFYYQVELPHWSLQVGEDEKTTKFLKEEGNKIIKDYGNHPSFILMSLGNELQGDANLMNAMVKELKEQDNRHLYTTTSFSFQKNMGKKPQSQDEFFISQWTNGGWIRGQGIFNKKAPHFNKDYSSLSNIFEIPLISHEIGQYSVFPDMSEIPKYTGVLNPLNFIAVKNNLERKGLIDLSDKFTNASGKLASILYKEEIERALKTPSFDGFQLLQLQDFPGQGTALVGLLNAFWESKGIISGENFRQFNSEFVPLIRFEKAIYESGETFNASIEVANFFKEMKNKNISWTITDDKENILKKGAIKAINLSIGNNLELGEIEFSIRTDVAKKLIITVALDNTNYKNSWSIWVYPKTVSITSNSVLFTSSIKKATSALKKGEKVLLNPDFKTLKGIEGRFVPVFWSPVHFPDQPSSMGLLLNKKHKAFRDFPTDSHTNWQWWDLCIQSKTIITDSLNVAPLVRVIDNFVTNHHLATIFEAKVGNGKLLFSSMDLKSNLDTRPVARQLRHSLLKYMEEKNFNPSKSIKIEDLNRLKLN